MSHLTPHEMRALDRARIRLEQGDTEVVQCPTCQGRKVVLSDPRDGSGETCPTCEGKGEVHGVVIVLGPGAPKWDISGGPFDPAHGADG